MFILLIDDEREHAGVRVARTYAAGIAALQERQWDYLVLDHDFGDFSGPDGRELTGYDVACWLEEHPEHLPKDIGIVSKNPEGRRKITLALSKFYPDKHVWVPNPAVLNQLDNSISRSNICRN